MPNEPIDPQNVNPQNVNHYYRGYSPADVKQALKSKPVNEKSMSEALKVKVLGVTVSEKEVTCYAHEELPELVWG